MTQIEKFPTNEYKLEIRKYGGKLWLFIYHLYTKANVLAKPLSSITYEVEPNYITVITKL